MNFDGDFQKKLNFARHDLFVNLDFEKQNFHRIKQKIYTLKGTVAIGFLSLFELKSLHAFV